MAFAVPCLAAPYEVFVTVTEEKTTDAGSIVTHVFTINNEGTQHDTYALDAEIPDGWASLPVSSRVLVLSGQTSVVFVNLSVPSSAEAGTYAVSLRVTSNGDPSVIAEAAGVIHVRTDWDLSLAWVKQPGRGQPGKWLEGSFLLTNTGNTPDEYLISLEIEPAWEVDLLTSTIGLMPGESSVIEFFVFVPESAAAGTSYYLVVRATSLADPLVDGTLSISDRLGPPAPHLVQGSVYPPWTVSTAFDISCDGEPTLALRGWGKIAGLGYIDASGTLSMTGIENPRLWLDTGEWSIYLDGGTIAGKFAGFSGSPLFGGRIGDQGLWRILFTNGIRATSGLWVWDCSSLRLTFGSDDPTSLSFEELDLQCDPAGPFAWDFFLGHATQTESGTTWGIGAELEFDNCGLWEFSGDFLDVSEGYPGQTPRKEAGVRGSFDGCVGSFEVSFGAKEELGGTPPNQFYKLSRDFNASVRFLLLEALSAGFSIGYGHAESDDAPQTVLSNTASFGVSFEGDLPLPWNVSWSTLTVEDEAAGTKTTSQEVTVGGILPLGAIRLSPTIHAQLLDDGITRAITSSAALTAVSDSDPAVEITLGAGGSASFLQADVTWVLASGARVSWVTEVAVCDRTDWSTGISAQFPASFPFCGPSKGRISGYVFIDENENLLRDFGEPGVEGVLLAANGSEAVTGEDGWFIFLPFAPGVYSVGVESLPIGLVAAVPLPLSVSIVAGSEPEIMIPLQKRSWLRGVVYQDANQNGVRDLSEIGIGGVRLLVTGPGLSQWVTTDAAGRFALRLPPGSYTAELDPASLPERFAATTSGAFAVSVEEEGIVDLSFGAYRRPRPVVVTFGPPTASFTYDPGAPTRGEPIQFAAVASSPMGSDIVLYEWEFTQGGSREARTGRGVTIALPTAGTWLVQLVVTDQNGLKGVSERDIVVR